MSELAKWYVVHTYSGYENSVAANILKAAENRKMQDLIQEVNIPMETVKEITDSGEKTVERKVFPGYVLVKMVLTDESWHLVHNVRGAAGFVGSDGKAIPLTEQEIYDLGITKWWSAMSSATPSRSPTARSRASSARWTSSSPTRTVSASSFPCSAERRPSTSNSIRSKRSRIKILQERGAFKWHRK